MKQTNYKVAIPSYKRATTLRDKTLKILQEHKIPPSKIHIFVADKKEKKKNTKKSYQNRHIIK